MLIIDTSRVNEQQDYLHLCGTGKPEYQNIQVNTNNAELKEKDSNGSFGKLAKRLIRRSNIWVCV